MRQTIREIEVNVAYRWFIGYDLFEKIPHFSTFGKNYSCRFAGTQIFERVFLHILNEAVECGFVDAGAIFIDGTHIKASANKKKNTKMEVEISARNYQEQLDKEIDEDRAVHGKRPLKRDKPDDNDDGSSSVVAQAKTITVSTTDPECGLFHKGEHEKQFAYVSGVACDKHNFVLGYNLAPGNTHDSTMFSELYQDVTNRFPEAKAVAVDAGYKIPATMKEIIGSQRIPCVPYRRPKQKTASSRSMSTFMMNTMIVFSAQIIRDSAIPQLIGKATGNTSAIRIFAGSARNVPSAPKAKPVKR